MGLWSTGLLRVALYQLLLHELPRAVVSCMHLVADNLNLLGELHCSTGLQFGEC